ncbi:hypothetical protein OD91_2671 [Lutibacter sp. Hel_I_33_5]|uniref:hypothetical protein n=1 Tax=Lutibacter sp. Hel_I_33_5 TaxID=1566289 RepID=UPI0011A92381|nr:hypothetical protein [Lutibacter sp. Hel_I_33_5]TVZ57350.1 hypothetical protein OD91_2671 [Lutibacter sp. Hel_I_33_5]
MRIRKLSLLMILSLVFFTNCNSDNSTQTETLSGSWTLKNVRGGLQGINIDYNHGEVEWIFNLNNNTLIVENNIISTGPEDIYSGLDSGKYDIQVEQNDKQETLFINNTERGVIILLSATSLKIDNGLAADGFITEFER